MSNDEPSEKELSFWEKAVGLSFNPFWDDKVLNVKRLFASVIDVIDYEEGKNNSYMKNILKGIAIRSCITAQMAVVKFLTWKD